MVKKERVPSKTPRYNDFLEADGLTVKTGFTRKDFPKFILKELIDNALDAVESRSQLVTPRISISIKHFDNKIKISVSDNGEGISERIINELVDLKFSFSDKIDYCSPSRGRMGHAISCILGMPYALRGEDPVEPVVIESLGTRYYVEVASDSADLNDDRSFFRVSPENMENIPGTKIIVTIPDEKGVLVGFGRDIVARFAMVNPHAHITYSATYKFFNIQHEVYDPIIDSSTNKWKYLPNEPIPPRWYEENIFKKHIKSLLADNKYKNKPITLISFISSFRGLNDNKIKRICANFPGVKNLSFLDSNRYGKLLKLMRDETTPHAKDLGFVGEHNFKEFIEKHFSVIPGKIWYEQIINENEIPYIVECVLAESSNTYGEDFFAINFSPAAYSSFTTLELKKAKDGSNSIGYYDFRKKAEIPYTFKSTSTKSHYLFILHIISPHINVLDKGKTRVNITEQMVNDIFSIIWDVSAEVRSKPATKKKSTKDKAITSTDAVIEILPQAVEEATENNKYLVNVRGLYYVVRRYLLKKYEHISSLGYNHFSQKILKAYKEKQHPLPNVYSDARGFLYEPHTGTVTQVGDLEIRDYEFPEWNHNKILYIEKKGLLNTLQSAKIAEKYDMAILAGEGYSTEAAKILLQKGHKDENYLIIVFHDCDPDGYNIARTLRKDTSGMLSDYHIDVIDIGLKYQDAVKMNLIYEPYARKKDIPQGLDLTADEKEFFKIVPKKNLSKDDREVIKDDDTDTSIPLSSYTEDDATPQKGKKRIRGYSKRYEINAMTPAQMISFIENKLQFGFIDFTSEEFKDGRDVKTMCQAIRKDCYLLGEIETPDDTIDCAHEILCRSDLFQKLAEAKPHLKLTDDLVRLKNQTEEYRRLDFNDLQDNEQVVIRKFNRLLIELAYPEETPVSHKLDQKVIPNDDILSKYAQKEYDDKINSLITERVMGLLSIEEIIKNASIEKPQFENLIEAVKAALLENVEEGWKDLIRSKTDDTVQENIKLLSVEQLKLIIEKYLQGM